MSRETHFAKSVILATLIIVGAAAISFQAAVWLQVKASAPIPPQPFYLEKALYMADRSGSLVPSGREVYARRSDGSTYRLRTLPNQLEESMITVEYSDGRVMTFVPSLRASVSWQPGKPKASLSQQKVPPKDCGLLRPYTFLRFEAVSGVEAVVLQRSVPGQYRVTRWLSPQFGCEDLRYVSERLNADGSFVTTAEARLVRAESTEPSSDLFNVGEGYTPMKPSAVQQGLLEKMKGKLSSAELKRIEQDGHVADYVYQNGSNQR